MHLNNNETNEQEIAEFMERKASKLIPESNTVLFKTGDYHSYYQLKLSKNPYKNEGVVSDDCNHSSHCCTQLQKAIILKYIKQTMMVIYIT